MFSALLIVFREAFEIAIVVTVILAATQQVARRGVWIAAGIASGLVSVGILACFAPLINQLATQLGQHIFHALVLFVASFLIAGSVIWMHRHGREMTMRMKQISQSVSLGQTPLYMLAIVTGLAVLRDGSEVVLFLYGIYSTGEASFSDLIWGSFFGAGLGLLTGIVMYLGLIRIPVKQLFSLSGGLLTFLAAGMVAKGIGHLVKAGLVPAMINPLWNTSTILSQHSLLGRFLSVIIGYQDQPSLMQVIFYILTLVSIFLYQKKYA